MEIEKQGAGADMEQSLELEIQYTKTTHCIEKDLEHDWTEYIWFINYLVYIYNLHLCSS